MCETNFHRCLSVASHCQISCHPLSIRPSDNHEPKPQQNRSELDVMVWSLWGCGCTRAVANGVVGLRVTAACTDPRRLPMQTKPTCAHAPCGIGGREQRGLGAESRRAPTKAPGRSSKSGLACRDPSPKPSKQNTARICGTPWCQWGWCAHRPARCLANGVVDAESQRSSTNSHTPSSTRGVSGG